MASHVTPDSLRQTQFRSTFRGLDPTEVQSVLESAAAKLEELDAERRKLQAKLADAPESPDLETEFDRVGTEVSAILQSAREAADSMRERATLDATKWRGEAMEEADSTRKLAAADAESMRRDAWVTGTEILDQTSASAEAQRAQAERDVLTIMGEAEREAHRLTSGARRDAEDVVRNASMDAEQVSNEATKRRDEIIDTANRQAAAAQERTRALEQRREELLDELENVRSTLTRLEGSLEERREALDLTSAEPSSVRVVHPPSDAKKQWELGETVRVVPPDGPKPPPDESLADEVSEQVARASQTEPVEPIQDPEPAPVEPAPEDAPTPPPDPLPAPEHTPETVEPVADSDELDALFASLRGGGERTQVEGEPTPADSSGPDDAADSDESAPTGVDWIEVREERLLPITNRALRGVKKAMTEVQNVALDSLRTDDEWRPDEATIAEAVHAELVAVWSESFAAGHSVAEQMTGSKLKRPPTPTSEGDRQFAGALAAALGGVLDKAGDGPRELQSAASRVFRVWRSDEAERRVRDIALTGYEAGIDESRKVAAGA